MKGEIAGRMIVARPSDRYRLVLPSRGPLFDIGVAYRGRWTASPFRTLRCTASVHSM